MSALLIIILKLHKEPKPLNITSTAGNNFFAIKQYFE